MGTWWSTFKQQPIFNDGDFRTWSMVVPTSVRDSMLNMNVENDLVVLGLWASVNYGADPFCPILLAKKPNDVHR